MEERFDATLVNALTQMGTNGDRGEHTTVSRGRKMPKQIVEELFKKTVLQRICKSLPEAAISKGWELTLSEDKEQSSIKEKYKDYTKRLKFEQKICRAQILANVYGGAAIVIIVADGKMPSEPLVLKDVKSIIDLQVLDCYKIIPDLSQIAIDPLEPEYYEILLPEYVREKFNIASRKNYNFLPNYKIHSSRILRFDGVMYTPDMLLENNGWGGSLIELLWEDYRDWKTGLKALSAMIHDCSLFVYKLKNLAEMVKNKDAELLQNRLHILRMMTSVFGGVATDAEGEDITFPSRNFAGVDNITKELRDAFIGASGIPHDKLFGESPSGLGATGESEENNWANTVHAFQVSTWLPILETFTEILFAANDGPTKGNPLKGWGHEFKSIKAESEEAIISQRSSQASTDSIYLNVGVLLPEEVRESRFGGAKYSKETILDRKAFEKKKRKEEEEASGEALEGEEDYSELNPAELSEEELAEIQREAEPIVAKESAEESQENQNVEGEEVQLDSKDKEKENDDLDKFVKKNIKKSRKIIDGWISNINSSLINYKSLDNLFLNIHNIFSSLDDRKMTELLEQNIIISHLLGMSSVNEEMINNDAVIPDWLKLKFGEQIKYFRRKVNIPTTRWNEFTAQMHDYAFTVANLTKADLLSDARWLVNKAIEDGNDIETFKKQFTRLIGRKGWQASDQRMYIILNTNVRRSYAAGRYEQATKPEILKTRPYWVWKHRDSVVPRPNHKALNNKAIRADHPFWKIATPSCAYGCRCTFFTANQRTIKTMGYQILEQPPDPMTIAETGFQRAAGSNISKDINDLVSRSRQKLTPELNNSVSSSLKKEGITLS